MPPKKSMSFEEWKKAGKPSSQERLIQEYGGAGLKIPKEFIKSQTKKPKPAPKKKPKPKKEKELTAIQKKIAEEIDRIYNDEEGAKKFAEGMKSVKRYTEAEARALQAKDAKKKKAPVKKKEPVKPKKKEPVKQLKKIRQIMKDTRKGEKVKYKPTLDPITEEPKKKMKFIIKKK